jgi:hypothetical protein
MDDSNVASLIITIMQAIFINGIIFKPNFISTKLTSFGVDGVSIFQGRYTSVIILTPISICSIHD